MDDDCADKSVDIWKVFDIVDYDFVDGICRHWVIVIWYVKMEGR